MTTRASDIISPTRVTGAHWLTVNGGRPGARGRGGRGRVRPSRREQVGRGLSARRMAGELSRQAWSPSLKLRHAGGGDPHLPHLPAPPAGIFPTILMVLGLTPETTTTMPGGVSGARGIHGAQSVRQRAMGREGRKTPTQARWQANWGRAVSSRGASGRGGTVRTDDARADGAHRAEKAQARVALGHDAQRDEPGYHGHAHHKLLGGAGERGLGWAHRLGTGACTQGPHMHVCVHHMRARARPTCHRNLCMSASSTWRLSCSVSARGTL